MMKRVYYGLLAACLALALCAASALAAGPFYVTTTGAGNKDGSTWANACDKIQDAINKAATASENGKDDKGVAVFVKAGTYSLNESIQLKKGALVYGGFAGTETTLESRDIAKNETILDGAEIPAGTVSASVIICFGQDDNGNMLANAETHTATSTDTCIDGFTITNGKGTADPVHKITIYGGGIYLRKTSPRIANCTFKKNKAGTGGAISINSKQDIPVIFNCRFEENEAEGKGLSGNSNHEVNGGGGAIAMTDSPKGVIIDNCTFISNKAKHGGAIYMTGKTDMTDPVSTITNCTFTLNTAVASKSPISNIADHNGAGGALLVYASTTNDDPNARTINITNCTFINNKATKATDGSEICLNKTDAKVNLINTILYDDKDVLSGDAASFDVTNCAYPSGKVKKPTVPLTSTLFSSNLLQATAKANGVTHTVYKLLAAAESLIKGGQTVSGVTADQLGMARPSRPSIGAVEYLEVAVSTDTLPSGTVSTDYKQTLEAKVTPTQDASLVSWDITSGDLPDGIKLIGSVISGTPTKVGSFDITVRVTVGVYEASKDLTLVINAIPVVTSSPDIGTVSITVKNAVGSNTAAFSVTSGDVKLVTSNDLTSSVKVNGTAYKLASSDATPVFSVNAGNATLKAAYMGDTNSDWSSTSDLKDLTITNLTAISGQEAISETSPDYYRFQFCVSDDYYFTLEVSVLLSGEPEIEKVTGEIRSGSVTASTEPIVSDDGTTYYYVPANGSNNLVTKSGSTWILPAKIDFSALTGGFSGFISRMRAIERTIAQIVTGIFQPNANGLFTNIGAALSTPVHPGTIFIIRLAPSGWRLPFMTGFERGAMRVAKVEDGAIIGAMTVQNENGSDINEEITTLNIDTSDLRDPDDSTKKVPVPEGAYAISYSTLNGEVYGAFSDDIKVAAANYTPSNGDDDTDTDDEQETSSHGGSSGCNAGFGLFALAALALAYNKFRK